MVWVFWAPRPTGNLLTICNPAQNPLQGHPFTYTLLHPLTPEPCPCPFHACSPSPAAPSPSIVSMQHQHRLAYASSLYSHDNKLACMAAATAAPAGAMTTALEPIATGSTASSQAHTACKQHHGMPRPHGPSCGLASATQPGAGKAQVQPHQKHSHHHPTSHNQQHQHQHQQVYWVYRASVGPAEAHAMCEAVRAAGCNSSLMALEHSPELTLQLYGCLELVAMDQAVADAAGMQDAEAHDLRTGQVTFLHRNGPGAPWAVVSGWFEGPGLLKLGCVDFGLGWR